MSAEQPRGAERRREVRVTSLNLINYSVPEDPDDPQGKVFAQLGTAMTLDLSANGCRLRSTHPMPVGEEVTFDLQLGEHIVHCRGRIARIYQQDEKAWEVGIAFHDLDPVAQDGLRMYLSFKDDAQ